jgi:hypothetical protein
MPIPPLAQTASTFTSSLASEAPSERDAVDLLVVSLAFIRPTNVSTT